MTWEIGKEYQRKNGTTVRFLGEIKGTNPLVFAVPQTISPLYETVLFYKADGQYPAADAQYRKFDILLPFPTEAEAAVIEKMKRVLGTACRASDEDLLDIVRELRRT